MSLSLSPPPFPSLSLKSINKSLSEDFFKKEKKKNSAWHPPTEHYFLTLMTAVITTTTMMLSLGSHTVTNGVVFGMEIRCPSRRQKGKRQKELATGPVLIH